MYQIMDLNNNIMQHHANDVDPVLMSTHYSYTIKTQIIIYLQYHICYEINVYKLLTCGIC